MSQPIELKAGHHAFLDLTVPGGAAVDLGVTGSISLELHTTFPATLTTDGGRIAFIEGSQIAGGQVAFNSELAGQTSVKIVGGFATGSNVAFNDTVGSGLVFQASGISTLTLNDPTQFHAEIEMGFGPVGPVVDLVGLAQADHWSYRHDVLTIGSADNQVVDKLHIVSDTSQGAGGGGLALFRLANGAVEVAMGSDHSGSLKVA